MDSFENYSLHMLKDLNNKIAERLEESNKSTIEQSLEGILNTERMLFEMDTLTDNIVKNTFYMHQSKEVEEKLKKLHINRKAMK